MSEEELIKRTVRETLEELGVNPDQPILTQQDFAYLRELRLASLETRRIVKRYAIATFLVGMTTVLILGVKAWLRQNLGG